MRVTSTAAPSPWQSPAAPTAPAGRPPRPDRDHRDGSSWGPYLNLSQRVSSPDNGPDASTEDVLDVEFATDGRAGKTAAAFGRLIGDNLAWMQWYSIEQGVEERAAAAALHDAILGSGLLELEPSTDEGPLPLDHMQLRYNRELEDGTNEELTFRAPLDALPQPFLAVVDAVEAYQALAGPLTPTF